MNESHWKFVTQSENKHEICPSPKRFFLFFCFFCWNIFIQDNKNQIAAKHPDILLVLYSRLLMNVYIVVACLCKCILIHYDLHWINRIIESWWNIFTIYVCHARGKKIVFETILRNYCILLHLDNNNNDNDELVYISSVFLVNFNILLFCVRDWHSISPNLYIFIKILKLVFNVPFSEDWCVIDKLLLKKLFHLFYV